MSFSGLIGSVNGDGSAAVPVTVAGVFPLLVTSTYTVAFLATGIVPKFTTGLAAVSRLTAPVPTADRLTVVPGPFVPATVNEPLAAPAPLGANVTWTGIDLPGMIWVPTLGRPVAVNGPDGGVTEVTVSAVVP